MKGRFFLWAGLAGLLWNCGSQEADKVDFNTQIRPILNAACLSCHGGVKQAGGVSLLFREEALLAGKSGRRCIVPGKPEESELVARLTHSDPDERMPLKHPPLKPEQVDLIKKWIKQGAEWETHWAYIPPKPQPVPATSSEWVRNPVDAFILQKLESEDLQPSPEADRATLLRRVSLDLTGLPPTPTDYARFLNNKATDAYEQEVDRLLTSPQFGERWAALWLDLARYGDSRGYQKDRGRTIWPYRDWVIRAFNQDMPFDQFTIRQLAGDLLPEKSVDNLLATAFHRNTMTNDEGGTDDEEFRTVAVLDRVNTTFEIWQGTTIACVQCHSHPYDPFRHKEYYQLVAYFNNTADADRDDDAPLLPDKTPVMRELPPDSSRKTHVFVRGNWLVHGDQVRPDVPKTLKESVPSHAPDRLALARWLVNGRNPLTARVTVNRFWEQLFGLGLVETLEDFGTQGAKPSHPELLDYLAVEFVQTDRWSVKKLLRRLTTSATYRQASTLTLDLRERDPQNRLLARGPRVRLTAEQVRDQALAVSGLLSKTQFGPPVMPPQPEGVWQVIRNVMKWKTAEGEDRYRRAIYTYWRKSSPYPSFLTFDSPSRELCVSRRIRTNTPLQALVTLNDPVYWESAQALAGRLPVNNPTQAIRTGYQFVTGKAPSEIKLAKLKRYYEQSLAHYRRQPKDAAEVVTLPHVNPTPERAALTLTANVLLNMDEAVVKE